MATPEHSAHSRRLHQAALADAERLARELQKTERRIAKLRGDLARAEQNRGELHDRLELLSRLTGQELRGGQRLELVPPQRAEERREPANALRGAAIRAVAVRLLASSPEPLAPIHHQAWLELVREAGYEIGGQDPGATFLTQLSRSPVVARTGEPGTYALDLDAPAQLEARLAELREELAALHQGQQTIEAISSTRERRDELSAELTRVERLLIEAVESLGLEGASD